MSLLALVSAAVIAAGVLLGIARLWLRRARILPATRGPLWRAVTLSALQASAGAALHLTLFPLGQASAGDTLVIATAGAPGAVALAPGERLIALPEARATRGGARAPDLAPDLATALRRHNGVRTIRVVGSGLTPRDQESLTNIAVDFAPPPPPRGLVRIALPGPIAPGNTFAVAGEIGALREGVAELIDPAGAIAAQARIKAGALFQLSGTARVPGLALFVLRVRDGAGRIIEAVDVPIDAAPRPPPRALVLAGAPSAENKFLRRWALDAGIALTLEIDAGGGVQLGDPATPLTSAALGAIDLLVIDDRRWEAIGPAGRAAVLTATEGGMGLLLRAVGLPSPEVRQAWAGLGLRLPGVANATESALDAAELPEPTAAIPLPKGANLVPLIEDIAAWTPRGLGRIGLLTTQDNYVLALTGRGNRLGQRWSTLFTALARADRAPPGTITGFARAGSRVVVCGLSGSATVQAPGSGAASLLLEDRAAGLERCAGYWPTEPGWHSLRGGAGETHFYVHPATALPSMAAAEAAAATLALVSPQRAQAQAEVAPRASRSPWLWFALLLIALAALWWLERTQVKPQHPDPRAASN